MPSLLPVGAYVRVTPFPIEERRPYTGCVLGYDIHRTKYQIGCEYLPGHFADWPMWAFPRQVEEIVQANAEAAMPEHESWCCRSPVSPCALAGGCSGSCNCGVDESIQAMPGPSISEQHAASQNLMAAGFAASSSLLQQRALKAETDRQAFLARAQIIGVDQETAERILHELIEERLARGLSLDPVFRLAFDKIYVGEVISDA